MEYVIFRGEYMFNKSRLVRRTLGTLVFVIALITASLSANAEIFVTNDDDYTVTVYANSASGDAAPIRKFDVPARPRGIHVDTEIFVATQWSDNSIYVFDIDADGADLPIRTIDTEGDLQGIYASSSEIFVADRDGDRILVFARGATGSAAPLRSILLDDEPRGVSVDVAAGELYVSISNDVLTFSLGASGSAVPLRTITSSLGDMSQVTFDRESETLVVANHGSYSIQVWPRAQNGGASPIRSITGEQLRYSSPRGAAVCADTGEYFATSKDDDAILVYAANASGESEPLRIIEGDATGLDSPRFMQVTGCNVIPVPTMSVWGLGILAGLLGLMGFVRRRKA